MRIRFLFNALLMTFFAIGTSSCATQTSSETAYVAGDNVPSVSKKRLKELDSPWKGTPRPSNRTGEFYAAIYNQPLWVPDSASNCVDESALAWLRKIFSKQGAQVSIIAVIKPSGTGESNGIRIPLFLMGINEAPVEGQPKCFSQTVKSLLTPWFRADANTTFDVSFEVATSKKVDAEAAKRIFGAVDEVLRFAGSNNFIVTKLTGDQILAAGKNLDKRISEHLTTSTLDETVYQFHPLPDGTNSQSFDGLEFSAETIDGGAKEVKFGSKKLPAFRFGLVYTSSVFASSDGLYPSEYTQLLTRALAPQYGFAPPSLKSLVEEGIGGISRSNLEQMSDTKVVESLCKELRLQLSKGFSTGDSLVSRFAILRHFSPQVFRNSNLVSDECLSQNEQTALGKLGYTVPSADRDDPRVRNESISQRMTPLVQALRQKQADDLRKLVAKDIQSLRIVAIGDLKDFPTYMEAAPTWSGDGDQAFARMLALGVKARIGCFKASPQGTLNQIGAVVLAGNQVIGAMFYWSKEGLLEQIFLGSIRDIRNLGALGTGYADSTSCDLI